MFLALDYYVTESSGHNSEYNWWFRKRPDLIEKYCTHGTGWNPGEYAYDQVVRGARAATGATMRRSGSHGDADLAGARARIRRLHHQRLQGGEPFEFNGNVANHGLIDNLPQGACVEVPVWASRKGLQPVHVGALPPQCAMLTSLSSQIEEMAVEGCLTGDPTLVYQAIAHDPLTAAVLSLAEIKQMVNEMFAANREYLPTFTHYET